MPGTIQVSVLGFTGIESSSMPSQTSIKGRQPLLTVSLGKRAYQSLDKGDFSFPLETFRDKLVIALQDAEGNEISHADVETRLVVEKGTWDDRFPLGGGYVHLKLQFILSEEDRQRIRTRRELALRKKHQELLSSRQHKMKRSFSSPEVGVSLYLNCEVSDSQDCLLQSEAEQADQESNAPNFSGNGKSDPKNDTDIYKRTSSNTHVPQEFDVHPAEAASNRISESNVSAKTKSNTPKLEEDKANESERQTPSAKTYSNVRNMISAFENSLSQDTRPQIRVPSAKSQPIRTARIASPLPTKELQQGDPTYIGKRAEQTNFPADPDVVTTSKDSGLLKGVNRVKNLAEGKSADLKNESKFMHKECEAEEKKTFSKGMMRTSTCEMASISGIMVDDQSSKHQPMNLSVKRHFRKESSKRGCLNDSRGEDVQRSSNEILRSRMAWEDKHHSLESSGVWIFPDGARKLCITSGGKQIRNLMDGFWPEAVTKEGNAGSALYNVEEESVHSGIDIEERTSQGQRNSKVDRSRNIDTPGGPFGQSMKIAIMVGFGTLVLLTRQRNADG